MALELGRSRADRVLDALGLRRGILAGCRGGQGVDRVVERRPQRCQPLGEDQGQLDRRWLAHDCQDLQRAGIDIPDINVPRMHRDVLRPALSELLALDGHTVESREGAIVKFLHKRYASFSRSRRSLLAPLSETPCDIT